MAWRWWQGASSRLSRRSNLRDVSLRHLGPRNHVEGGPRRLGGKAADGETHLPVGPRNLAAVSPRRLDGKAAVGETHRRVILKAIEVPGGLASWVERSSRHRSSMKGMRSQVVATGGQANRLGRTDLPSPRRDLTVLVQAIKDHLSEQALVGNRAGNRTGSRTVLAG